jgi:FkbM family methyltransferase
MHKLLSRLKKLIICLGGLRKTFRLRLFGSTLTVDYTLRAIKPDRDYSIILQLAKGKKCVFDIGANHGIVSLLISSQNKDMQVYAFEASEAAVNIINHHIRLNNLTGRVKAINALIAERSGYTIPFYWQDSSGGASITKGRLGHTIEVEKVTLSIDDFVLYKSIFPDFIKMDIEGAESLAIKGMKYTLTSVRPLIMIELHGLGSKSLAENAAEILEYIRDFNYLMIYLRTGRVISDSDVLKDRGRCHVLLMPVEFYSEAFVSELDKSGL